MREKFIYLSKRKRVNPLSKTDRFYEIFESMLDAIDEVYENAKKNGTTLVISDKKGRVKKIKVK